MTNLETFKFIDIIPPSIKDDIQVIAIAECLDKQLHEIVDSIVETIILPRIDELSEVLIDLLAWQFHVDFYEPLGLDIYKKRQLVKNSISWHKRKGTKSVVEEIIKLLFFDDFEIKEWFEYDGEPYFFRLITTDNLLNENFYNDLLRAIYAVKNTRSWLDMIKLLKEFKMRLKVATVSTEHIKTVINCSKSKDCIASNNLITQSIPSLHKTQLIQSFKYRENICENNLNTSVFPVIVKKIIALSSEVKL